LVYRKIRVEKLTSSHRKETDRFNEDWKATLKAEKEAGKPGQLGEKGKVCLKKKITPKPKTRRIVEILGEEYVLRVGVGSADKA